MRNFNYKTQKGRIAIGCKKTNHVNEIFYDISDSQKRLVGNNGSFLFAAYGCALLERQTDSGTYVYTAINLLRKSTMIISRRKQKLDETDFESMAAKIYGSAVCGESRFSVEVAPDELSYSIGRENRRHKPNLSKIANQIFTEILPLHGYSLRERQVELTERMLSVIERKGITLAEAEVGTGKTHAYLIAGLLAKRSRVNDSWLRGHYPRQGWAESAHMPVVISTSSIALQRAIVSHYIPELSDILIAHGIIRKSLVAVIRKGKEHYICEARLERYYARVDEATQRLLELYRGDDAPFDLTNVNNLTPYIKRSICVSGKCNETCPFAMKCRYKAYIKMANSPDVDFQITNHNYFIADMIHRATGKRPLIPHYQLVIIDEAHKFLQVARSMYGIELDDKEIPRLAQDVHAFVLGKSNSGVNVHKLVKKLVGQSVRLFERLNCNIPESAFEDDETDRFPAVFDNDVTRRLKSIEGIATDTVEAAADSKIHKRKKDMLSKALWKLGSIVERISGLRKQIQSIFWLENRLEGEIESQALCSIPKDLDIRLYNDLWSSGIPIILTSGTLSASGDFTRAKETLGLNHLPDYKLFSTSMPSPFDFKNNAMIYISENTPFPDNKDKRYITAVADEIERLVIASHGHAAVLFTSYNAMGKVHAILKKRGLPFPLFRLERGSTNAIEQFKKSGNGILLASGALWEGIDIPGDTLSMLIIVKLPFAVPDPIGDYERELYGSMETYKARAVIPDMLVKLKQGFGRLIRKVSDTGVVAILDCRVNKRGSYRSKVLLALPICAITSSIAKVKNFFRIKKPDQYFE